MQKISSDFSAFSTKTAVVKALFRPFLHAISVCWSTFWLFCALHIIAFALRFGAFYPAFCCILHCVLLHFALRFGAFYLAFWCILHCVLVLNGACFGAFYPAFWSILPHILPQIARCGAQNVYLNRGKRIFIRLCTCPVLYLNKLAQYSQKCERMEGLLEKMQP